MTRAEDERRLWDVLRSKQATVPALADMLEEARAEGWDRGWESAPKRWDANQKPNPHRRTP